MSILAGHDKKSVKELSILLDVSEVTVRQDLNLLENKGILKRVHGGAVLNDQDDIAVRLGINYKTKLKIARKALEYIHEGETILIESGSVNALLSSELVRQKQVTILTTNIFIARQFHKINRANIILLGGLYQHQSESMVGMLTRKNIDYLNFSKAFIGIDGYDESTGFTSRDMLRAEISAHIISKCRDVFVVTDSTKFGRKELATIGMPEEIAHLITDEGISESYRQLLKDKGMDVIIAS
jgi:DeoR/GlpR family transcriptional regulator of sugar metabolism